MDEAENYLECYSFSKKGREEVIFENFRFFPSKLLLLLLLNYLHLKRESRGESFLFLFLMKRADETGNYFEYYSLSKTIDQGFI